jgi:cytochrome c
MTRTPLAFLSGLALLAVPSLGHCADGAKIYMLQCKTCHQAKSTLMGPSLTGASGRKIASLADFNYSNALKAKTGVWTDAQLDAFLASPAKFAPGNRMPAALPRAPDRAAVIAYIKTLK